MVAFGDFRSGAQIPLLERVATPSITRIAGGAHTRSHPVTVIESRVQLDARSPPQRLPRLHESLAEPTRGVAPSQRSEVVLNSTRDLLPSSDSLDYMNRWRSPHVELSSHSYRKSCSTRREIFCPGRGYGCPNIADIVTPPVYSHPFSERIAHNFPHGHRNRLCYHNSESTLRDGRQHAGFVEFRFGAKIPPWSVCTSTPTAVPSDRMWIFIRPGFGTAR
ncbi:hypothetical protein Taro_048113, partial [Colocasia esculenta]|nr:hypothetical protein [Colocasia esculenta]